MIEIEGVSRIEALPTSQIIQHALYCYLWIAPRIVALTGIAHAVVA